MLKQCCLCNHSSHRTYLGAVQSASDMSQEMFIQTLSEQGHNSVKAERKPRKNVQYKDLASAVARVDNLEFLSDIVPRTITYGALKAGRSNGKPSTKTGGVESGQTTLDKARSNGVNGGNRSSGASILSPRGEAYGEVENTSPTGTGKRIKQTETPRDDDTEDDDEGGADPNTQLEMEIRGAKDSGRGTESRMSNGEGSSRVEGDGDGDVEMS